jgi:hypothetical protein
MSEGEAILVMRIGGPALLTVLQSQCSLPCASIVYESDIFKNMSIPAAPSIKAAPQTCRRVFP